MSLLITVYKATVERSESMVIMTLILRNHVNNIKEIIHKELNILEYEGINIKEKSENRHNHVILYFDYTNVNENEDYMEYAQNKLKCSLTNALSDAILNEYEIAIAGEIIKKEYGYFTCYERKIIINHYENNIKEDKNGLLRRKIKSFVFKNLMSYIKFNAYVDLEGFIQFRLNEFRKEIENKIDRAIGDYLMEKEYNEFIKLLKYFVDIQDAKIDEINIFMDMDGKYSLYDDKGMFIDDEYLEEIAKEMTDKDVGYDDVLISSLITLAPKKIILHPSYNMMNKEIVNTISKVFCNKIKICQGCKNCIKVQESIKE